MLKLDHIEIQEYADLFLIRLFFNSHFLSSNNETVERKYAAEIKIFKNLGLRDLAYIFHRLAFLLEHKFPLDSSDLDDKKWIEFKEW